MLETNSDLLTTNKKTKQGTFLKSCLWFISTETTTDEENTIALFDRANF